jgi:hypothetical protein
LNSRLALVDSGLQLNLEIALSGVSPQVKPPTGTFQPGRKCAETSDDVIKSFVQDSRNRVKPFFVSDLVSVYQGRYREKAPDRFRARSVEALRDKKSGFSREKLIWRAPAQPESERAFSFSYRYSRS